jgi:hypothetical protein
MANSSAIRVFSSGGAASTPISDTRAVQARGNELETALHLLESEAAGFAKTVIVDPAARVEYTNKTKAAVAELIELVKQRKITPHEAACTANAMRNQIMMLARSRLSDFGAALSTDMKANGYPLSLLEEKYSSKRFGRAFSSLTQAERDLVWIDIVHAAGRSNPAVNLRVKWFGMAGRTFLVTSLALAVYNVTTATDHERQAAKEGASFVGGAIGGVIGSAAVLAIVSNPAGWVVGAAMFAGAMGGGLGSSELFDYFWPER